MPHRWHTLTAFSAFSSLSALGTLKPQAEEEMMTDHKTGTREEWLAARPELLEAEKSLTRRSDELARWRQEPPWVRIEKEYRFETDRRPADWATYTRERPGMSALTLEDGVVDHTHSAYARGLDGLWGMHQWLDRAPRGRNETGLWFLRHDEYPGE